LPLVANFEHCGLGGVAKVLNREYGLSLLPLQHIPLSKIRPLESFLIILQKSRPKLC
jgi:hypothetical protein